MAVSTAERANGERKHDSTGEFLFVGALLASGVTAAILLGKSKPVGTSACPGCATTAPALAAGLYETCSVPGNPNSCTIWRVGPDPSGKNVRWGYTTPAQFDRCEGAGAPVITSGFGFGDADSDSFIGTVQDISAACACPPGALLG